MNHRSEADYIDRTIATVRNHRGADSCWPQWANILADEIEDLRADIARLERADELEEDIAHYTRRMLQALDGYWLWWEGWNGPRDRRPLSESTAEDWWARFERYRARVEALLLLKADVG